MTVSAVPATLPDYDRNDWKQWTDADRDCQDARNEVLIAESRTAVAYRTDRKCRVTTGEWLAPYSNTIVTDPGRLDVDHMVPLGNAHDSGAWQWSAEQRERYTNYLEDPQHLIAVTASANRSKGARGPEEWNPDNRTYWCQDTVDWITTKSAWELTVTQAEPRSRKPKGTTASDPPRSMPSGPADNPTDASPSPSHCACRKSAFREKGGNGKCYCSHARTREFWVNNQTATTSRWSTSCNAGAPASVHTRSAHKP